MATARSLQANCNPPRRSSARQHLDPGAALISKRVRIFLFALTVGLATPAPVAAASTHKREFWRGHARAEHFHAIGRRDLAIGAWTGDRRAFGSASARW